MTDQPSGSSSGPAPPASGSGPASPASGSGPASPASGSGPLSPAGGEGGGEGDHNGVPPALAARISRDLASPPQAPVTAHALGIRVAGTLLAAQAGAVAVGLALGARPASELLLVVPALFASAALYAGGVALGREAIPGRGSAALTWSLAVGLGFAAALALAWAQERYAPDGPIARAGSYVCLAMGSIVALVPATLTFGVLRTGHAVRPRLAGLVLGALAGLVGLTTLHLHCPDVSVAHTGPMHVGVVAVLAALGMVASGSLLSRPHT